MKPVVAVIGGGPAGLRAAEIASEGGAAVTLFDAKASVGRKFLVAGRGGLNLTHAEAAEPFAARYGAPLDWWREALAEFDSAALRTWAAGLGIETFAASTGRVYPQGLKAAPLLRRWVARLRAGGVEFALHHRWTALRLGPPLALDFQTPAGARSVAADAVILALGGGSWPETGSDGAWTSVLAACGVKIEPLAPANCGWELEWAPGVLAVAEGQPVKNLAVRAAGQTAFGELLVTRYGLEGGALYQLGAALRALPEPTLTVDFKPELSTARLLAKLGPNPRDPLAAARQSWRLSPAAWAVLTGAVPPATFTSAAALAAAVKSCPLRLTRPRPLAEAISSAGGVAWSELDPGLMLRCLPGVFVAGEMIDWEAPTGGYLLQGCFATGTRAGRAAVEWLRDRPSR